MADDLLTMASLPTITSSTGIAGGPSAADANHASENGYFPLLGMRNIPHPEVRPLNDLQRRRTINAARLQVLFVGKFKSRTPPAFLEGAGSGRLEQLLKARALGMAGRGAGCRVPKSPAHGSQPLDQCIDLVGLVCQHLSVDARLPVGQKHRANFIQRKSGGLPQRNQCQLIQHAGGESASNPLPTDRRNESLFLVIAQR